ncbi:hypothetical protein EMN47_14230 [Prolixibacteraceae bacterium JC049]|nr:hypothetical protein [Prolixibacteraceae bacterium JC049]
MKFKNFIAILFILFSFTLYGQEKVEIPITHKNNVEWKKFFENEKLTLSVKYADCSDQENGIYQDFYLIRIENKTNQKLLVNWHYDLYYDGKCTSCNDKDNEFLFRHELKAKEIIEPSCSNYTLNAHYKLGILRSVINYPKLPVLSKAELSELKIYSY